MYLTFTRTRLTRPHFRVPYKDLLTARIDVLTLHPDVRTTCSGHSTPRCRSLSWRHQGRNECRVLKFSTAALVAIFAASLLFGFCLARHRQTVVAAVLKVTHGHLRRPR